MITPRTTRLFRAPTLQAFQRTIVGRIPEDPAGARACAVIVPTRSAAEELRRTIEQRRLLDGHDGGGRVVVMPDLLTRDEFYASLHARLSEAPALLSPFDREVLLRRSAREAQIDGIEPPFSPRPGLIPEIVDLYDELRRRDKTVADFSRLMVDELAASAETDRGAARLLQQTQFLVATFERFERATPPATVDEHGIRACALESSAPLFRQVIVTVGDQAADAGGLWTADFDLLARMPGVEFLDVVATQALLDSGFHTRLHERLLPGIEDTETPDDGDGSTPTLLVPETPAAQDPAIAFTCRDREEELAEFARQHKTVAAPTPAGRTAIVFQRPLPYLYLARQVFDAAGIAWQAFDALPLAAEPFAAAVDLLFAAAAADFTRGTLVELLGSPHFSFDEEGRSLTRAEIHALDRHLVTRKFLGGLHRLSDLGETGQPRGMRAAAAAATEIASAMASTTAQAQIRGLLAFIRAHERLPRPTDDWRARHVRARAAVLSALEQLAGSHAAHDPEPLSVGELSGSVRRWIEGQTFSPRSGEAGIRLLDARAAMYADVDEVRIVGLIESDWPERHARSIFYPQSLLSGLGWPSDQDRLASARARFHDLLALPRRRISLSYGTLEDDAIVSPSPLVEDLDRAGLRTERLVAHRPARVFVHEALSTDPIVPAVVHGAAARWLAGRLDRSLGPARSPGIIGPRAPHPYAVSRLEQYLTCPFKYFAGHVLRLDEERDEEAWMSPQEHGQFVHHVLERFFAAWQQAGNGAVTPANVDSARELFRAMADRLLDELPEGDRALERALLLGSAAAPGLAERVFGFEIEDEHAVIERLLEFELKGVFSFDDDSGPREIALRCKSDRIDMLDDGGLRLVDYKTGNAPALDQSLQLAVYGACAEQALAGRHGRSWTVERASYISLKGKHTDLGDTEMREGRARLLAVVDAVERGDFPVQPADPFRCTWCAFPTICRKDYVGDE